MKFIAVINQKGGVGKTTTVVNLGAALVKAGKSVLLLDMDPQANLTLHVDRRPNDEQKTMTNLLVDDVPVKDLVVATNTPGLDVVPADTSLSGVEQVLANRIGRETIIREAFEAYTEAGGKPYDYVFMDCPPSLGVLSANALVCAKDVIITTQTEYFALQGMAKLMEVVQLVKKRLNPELDIAFILACMVDQRTNLSFEVIREIERHFAGVLAKTMIRPNVKLAEAPSFGRTIFEHAPDSNGAEDYDLFACEFLARETGVPLDLPTEEEEEDEDELAEEEEVELEAEVEEEEVAEPEPEPDEPAPEPAVEEPLASEEPLSAEEVQAIEEDPTDPASDTAPAPPASPETEPVPLPEPEPTVAAAPQASNGDPAPTPPILPPAPTVPLLPPPAPTVQKHHGQAASAEAAGGE